MGRWQAGTRDRLERAALELFLEQGFADTTVPQITARAGLTTRTFFRYFADKREVLFAGEEGLPGLAASQIALAPPSLRPLEVIAHVIKEQADELFEGRFDYMRARRAVVDADEGLRERELRKFAMLSDAIKQGFISRRVDDLTSTLAAQAAVTVFSVSIARWLDGDGRQRPSEIMADTLGALQLVVGGRTA
jgi:AcrR family transcriptional regulator